MSGGESRAGKAESAGKPGVSGDAKCGGKAGENSQRLGPRDLIV